jgi:hypothetical protein
MSEATEQQPIAAERPMTVEERIAFLTKNIVSLKAKVEQKEHKKGKPLPTISVGKKGNIQVRGITGQYPVSYYANQLESLFAVFYPEQPSKVLEQFKADNKHLLSTKEA